MSGEFTSSAESRRGYISGQTFDLLEVEYAIVDGEAIFEGDIVLATVKEIERAEEAGARSMTRGEGLDSVSGPAPRGTALRGCIIVGASYRWPDGVIPYRIASSLTNQQRVTDAIRHWERNTSIRFVVRGTQSDYVEFVSSADSCSSSVGRQRGKQQIKLASGCGGGSTIHEIGHTVGLWHEQSREDRNRFVTIHLENVEDGKGHNFNQHISDGDDVGPYDYGSIMHYSRDAFSKNGLDTITPPAGVEIGQRGGLSNGDVAAVDLMYGSSPGNVHINRINGNGTLGSRVERQSWTSGWTTALPYTVGGQSFLFLLKAQGYGSDGNNVHLHRMEADGGVGARLASEKWTQGWSTAAFFSAGGNLYLFLLKKTGYASDRNNVHIHRMNADGTIGPKVAAYRWTSGWTQAVPYAVGGVPYLLLLKEQGTGDDRNNVHIHRLEADGKVGNQIAGYKWTEGWTTVTTYGVGATTYLWLMKRSGTGADGKNVHIHRFNADGSVGNRVVSYGWTEGWTQAVPYVVGGVTYVLLLKKQGTASDGNNFHIQRVSATGTASEQIDSERVMEGYTTVVAYAAGGGMRTLMLKA